MPVVINGTTGVSGVDGSAGTPSYQGADSNTGIFFPAADTIAFGEGGAEAMRIDSSGNVLVNSTGASGAGKFHINAADGTSVNEYSGLTISNTDDQTKAVRIAYNTANDVGVIAASDRGDSWKSLALNPDGGNVGVGTSSPNGKLDVTSTSAGNNVNLIFASNLSSNANTAVSIVLGASATPSNRSAVIRGINAGSNAMNLAFLVSNGDVPEEHARITSVGALKAKSGTAGYWNVSGSYHESTNSSETEPAHLFYSTNASFVNEHTSFIVNRSASSAYQLIKCYSGNASDNEFVLRGDGNAYADGTWNNNGADYAEFFESANGQALTLGATVILDGTKVREATSQDPASAIIGVVRPKEPSKASMVVGNTAWNKWANKYLTDDFDRYIMEDHDVVEWEEQVLEREAVAAVEAVLDEEGNEVSPAVPAQEAVYKTKQHSYESHNIPAGVTVPADAVRKTHDDKGNKFQHYKLNPAWDKDAEYINRENRPEWNIIGLLGQVKILKGQPVGDRWIKMRDVSATVEEWMIR